MMSVASLLGEMEFDALTALMDMSINRSNKAVGEIWHHATNLSIKNAALMEPSIAETILSLWDDGPLIEIQQRFDGAFCGVATLIFPASKNSPLQRLIIVNDKHGSLAQAGHLIFAACMETLGRLLKTPFTMSMPEVREVPSPSVTGRVTNPTKFKIVLLLYLNVQAEELVQGYIAIGLEASSIRALKPVLSDYIERML